MPKWLVALLTFLLIVLPACSQESTQQDKHKVTLVLDWEPNTNHTGLYVAKVKGYFQKQGLDVEIIQPGNVTVEQLVASGKADFGISTQESLTYARLEGIPLVSIGAILQHNTSGFASPIEKQIKRPRDFVGKTYGAFGSIVEKPMITTLMKEDQASSTNVKMNNVGNIEFLTAFKKGIDFMWIYQGWQGIEAELRGMKLNMIYLTDYSRDLDYYTPLIATSEKMIQQHPETVKKFMEAVSQGYQFAIKDPQASADILLQTNKRLNPKLVKRSQAWLSPRYQAEAPVWGYQKKEVWANYTRWLKENGVIKKNMDVEKAFTNQFLPQKGEGS